MRWLAIAIAVASAAGCSLPKPTRPEWVTYGVDGCGLSVAMPARPSKSRRALSVRVDSATQFRAYCERAKSRPAGSPRDVASAALGPSLNALFQRGYRIADAQYVESDRVPGIAIVLLGPKGAYARLLGAYAYGDTLLVLDAVVEADERETLAQFTKSLRISRSRRTVASPLYGEVQ